MSEDTAYGLATPNFISMKQYLARTLPFFLRYEKKTMHLLDPLLVNKENVMICWIREEKKEYKPRYVIKPRIAYTRLYL